MFLSLTWWEGAARNRGEAVSIEKLSAVTSWNCGGEHKKLTVKSDAFSYKGQLLLVLALHYKATAGGGKWMGLAPGWYWLKLGLLLGVIPLCPFFMCLKIFLTVN